MTDASIAQPSTGDGPASGMSDPEPAEIVAFPIRDSEKRIAQSVNEDAPPTTYNREIFPHPLHQASLDSQLFSPFKFDGSPLPRDNEKTTTGKQGSIAEAVERTPTSLQRLRTRGRRLVVTNAKLQQQRVLEDVRRQRDRLRTAERRAAVIDLDAELQKAETVSQKPDERREETKKRKSGWGFLPALHKVFRRGTGQFQRAPHDRDNPQTIQKRRDTHTEFIVLGRNDVPHQPTPRFQTALRDDPEGFTAATPHELNCFTVSPENRRRAFPASPLIWNVAHNTSDVPHFSRFSHMVDSHGRRTRRSPRRAEEPPMVYDNGKTSLLQNSTADVVIEQSGHRASLFEDAETRRTLSVKSNVQPVSSLLMLTCNGPPKKNLADANTVAYSEPTQRSVGSETSGKTIIRFGAWMSDERIRRVRFWDLIFPGTHNSASWELSSEYKRKWSQVVMLFLRLYIHCQATDVYSQLLAGIRFLDLRVCKHPVYNEPFCAHGGFRTVPLKQVLDQVALFLQSHPTEIVLLSVRRDIAFLSGPGSLGLVEADFWVAACLKRFLGPELAENITIGELADRHQNIVYFFEERERFLPVPQESRRISGETSRACAEAERLESDQMTKLRTNFTTENKEVSRSDLNIQTVPSHQKVAGCQSLKSTRRTKGVMVASKSQSTPPLPSSIPTRLRLVADSGFVRTLPAQDTALPSVDSESIPEIRNSRIRRGTGIPEVTESFEQPLQPLQRMVTFWVQDNLKKYGIHALDKMPQSLFEMLFGKESDRLDIEVSAKFSQLLEKARRENPNAGHRGIDHGKIQKIVDALFKLRRPKRTKTVPPSMKKHHKDKEPFLSESVTRAVRGTFTPRQKRAVLARRADSLCFTGGAEHRYIAVETALVGRHRAYIKSENHRRSENAQLSKSVESESRGNPDPSHVQHGWQSQKMKKKVAFDCLNPDMETNAKLLTNTSFEGPSHSVACGHSNSLQKNYENSTMDWNIERLLRLPSIAERIRVSQTTTGQKASNYNDDARPHTKVSQTLRHPTRPEIVPRLPGFDEARKEDFRFMSADNDPIDEETEEMRSDRSGAAIIPAIQAMHSLLLSGPVGRNVTGSVLGETCGSPEQTVADLSNRYNTTSLSCPNLGGFFAENFSEDSDDVSGAATQQRCSNRFPQHLALKNNVNSYGGSETGLPGSSILVNVVDRALRRSRSWSYSMSYVSAGDADEYDVVDASWDFAATDKSCATANRLSTVVSNEDLGTVCSPPATTPGFPEPVVRRRTSFFSGMDDPEVINNWPVGHSETASVQRSRTLLQVTKLELPHVLLENDDDSPAKPSVASCTVGQTLAPSYDQCVSSNPLQEREIQLQQVESERRASKRRGTAENLLKELRAHRLAQDIVSSAAIGSTAGTSSHRSLMPQYAVTKPPVSSVITPFHTGRTRILKSWNQTTDPDPYYLTKKLVIWVRTDGHPKNKQKPPYILKILAGEVTPPSFGSPDGSIDVLRYWTVQGATALALKNGGLVTAAKKTHALLLTKVLTSRYLSRVNGVTHDFVDEHVVGRIIKTNIVASVRQTKQQSDN